MSLPNSARWMLERRLKFRPDVRTMRLLAKPINT
jgi:hypothetical protein